MLDAGLEFAHPHCFWLLPLPLLVFRLIPAYRTRQSAIKFQKNYPQLSFSFGYNRFESDIDTTLDIIDRKMYKNKATKKGNAYMS